MRCLDELTVLAMADGRLEPEELDAAEAHVDGCDACRELLAELARSSEDAPSQGDGASFEPGELVGRYLILHRLGQGGMGMVYAAWDPDLERRVALKVVADPRASDPRAQAQLVSEAKAMAAISHRNVIGVYAVERLQGRICIAMEYMDGGTLTQWLQRSPRPPWRVVFGRLLEAGAGLAAAHAAGLVHRDFKPDNVLLARGEHGSVLDRVCVTDFGLARAPLPTDPHGVNALRDSTRPSSAAGTPAYMAPEQRRALDITPRADQYAFCVTMWEALFGARPMGDDRAFASSESSPVASVRGNVGRTVPSRVRRVLQRGLATDPAGRHADMLQLLEALRRAASPARARWLAGAATLGVALAVGVWSMASGDSPSCGDDHEGWQSAWGARARADLRAGFEATGAEYASSTFDHFERKMNDYVESWAQAHLAACVASRRDPGREAAAARLVCLESHREQAVDLLNALVRPDRHRMQRAVTEALRLPRIAQCERIDAPPSAPEHEALAELDAEVDKLARLRRLGGAADLAERLVATESRAESMAEPGLVARAMLVRAALAHQEASYDEERALSMQAAMLAVRGDRPEIAARAFARVGALEAARNRPEWTDHFLALAESLGTRLGEVTALHAELASLRGRAKMLAGDTYDARTEYERAVSLGEETLGPDHPDILAIRVALAGTIRYMERPDDALVILESVLRTQIAAFGETHLDVASTLDELGNTLSQLERGSEAIEHHTRAVSVRRRILGDRHPEVAVATGNLGMTLIGLGEPAQALPLLEEAEAIFDTVRPGHTNVLHLRHQIAHAHALIGEREQARDIWLEVLEDLKARSDPPAFSMWVHVLLGRTLAELGEYGAAREQFRRAKIVAAEVHGEGTPELMVPVVEEALVLLLEGRPDPAPLEQALEYDRRVPLHDVAARARFYLARVNLARGGTRSAALALAAQALAAAETSDPTLAATIEAWMAEQ